MCPKLLYFLVILNLFQLSIQNINDNEIEVDETPYADIASDLLKDKNMENIGGMIGDFMQSDNGKQIGDMLMSGLGNKDIPQKVLQVYSCKNYSNYNLIF